jgi:hypothetical protein
VRPPHFLSIRLQRAALGALPGGVLGFVGGFAKDAFEAPIKAAGHATPSTNTP